jgi:hypothetical protein
MRSAVMFAGVLFTFSLMQPAAAQTFKYEAGLFGQPKKAPHPPNVDWNWRPFAAPAPAQKPAVICGMTVVPADPKVDPKMRVAPPANGTTFTMTVVPPTICKAP